MNMQDNELDELFRSKLGGLEMQPSAHIWDNINATLGEEKKRSWTPVLSMAATLLVMLSVGAWFLLDKPAKVEQGQVASRIKKTNAVKQTQPGDKTETPVVQNEIKPEVIISQPVNNMAAVKHPATVKKEGANISKTPEFVKENVAVPDHNEPVQALAAIPANTVTNPVVPEMTLAAKTIDVEATAIKSTIPVAPLAVTAQQPEKKKRRGIHSLGGIINAVVSAVDKREDKFIEFTETDEDQANITGLNLGLIKIKKDK